MSYPINSNCIIFIIIYKLLIINNKDNFTFDIALIASSLLPNSTFASPDGRLLLLKRMRISTGSNGSKN